MGESASIPCEFCDQSVDCSEYDAHLVSCRYAHGALAIPITFMVGADEDVDDNEDDSEENADDFEFLHRYITSNRQLSGGANIRTFLEDHFSSGNIPVSHVQHSHNQNLLMLRVPYNQRENMRLTSYEYYSSLSNVEVGVSDIESVSTLVDYDTVSGDNCAICQQSFKDIWFENVESNLSIRRLRCDHVYCDECISIWLRAHKSCPVCKQKLE